MPPRPYDELVPDRPDAVYLHIGPPKTGTTYLQDILWRNRSTLGERGLTVPARPVEHFHAALDLRGIAFGGYDDPAVQGSWARLAGRVRGAGARVVISHEVLAGADVDQIAEAVSSFAPADVHVVYAVRDLARQLPAVWQESLKNRRTRTFERFLDRALDPHALPDRGFWRAQQPLDVLSRWARFVPRERIQVITLPPVGSNPRGGHILWGRFCAALEVDGSGLDLDVARTNASLSAVQAELLRLLNKELPDDLAWPAYERIVKRRFNQVADSAEPGRRVKVPGRYRETVLALSEEIISGLAAAGYPVIGCLADLRPADDSFGRAASVPGDNVADAAVALLATVLGETDRDETVGQKARLLLGRIHGRGHDNE